MQERSIGAILVDSGKLSISDAERVLRYQKVKAVKFGDAAIALGVVTAADIQAALATQYEYPYLTSSNDHISREIISAHAPFSSQAEGYRALRSKIMLRYFADQEESKIIVVSSPGRLEGRSYTAANLAVVFSQLGDRTLLIDADMRNPRQYELFGVENKVGLSSALSGRGGLENASRIDSLPGLSVLSSGPTPPNPQELLARDEFKSLLLSAKHECDTIIIDTPCAAAFVDAQTVAIQSSGVVFSCRKHYTSLNELEACQQSFQELGVPILGVILSSF